MRHSFEDVSLDTLLELASCIRRSGRGNALVIVHAKRPRSAACAMPATQRLPRF